MQTNNKNRGIKMTEVLQLDKIKITTRKDKNIEKYLKSVREEKTIKILESEYRVFNIEIMELSKGKTAFIDLVEVDNENKNNISII